MISEIELRELSDATLHNYSDLKYVVDLFPEINITGLQQIIIYSTKKAVSVVYAADLLNRGKTLFLPLNIDDIKGFIQAGNKKMGENARP